MWVCAGKDFTSNSYIQQPDPTLPSVHGGSFLSVTGAYLWIGGDTAHAMERLEGGVAGVTSKKAYGRERGDSRDGRGVGVYQGWKNN